MWAENFYVEEESLKGSTYMGEMGWHYISEDSPWNVEARLRGYVGQREGVSGKVQVIYNF